MRGIGPAADDGCHGTDVDEVVLLDDEVRTLEEGGHSAAKKQRAYDAVQREEELERAGAEEVADFVLKLIADSL